MERTRRADRALRIGEFADRVGINPKTLRYYESVGVLPEPQRTSSRYRLYTESDVERVRCIQAAQALGLALSEIKEILAFRDRGECPCPHVMALIERHARDLDQEIEELRRLRTLLRGLVRRASRMSPDQLAAKDGLCHVIESTAARKKTDRAPSRFTR